MWVVGVVLATFASAVSNLGLNLQKLTHVRNAATAQASVEPVKSGGYYKQRLWALGLALIILGSVADFVALGFGAQSIIAPLGSLTLVANVIFAPLLLKEPITSRDVIATLTIVVGSALSVAFASHENTTYSVDDLFGFYLEVRFGVYAIIVVLAITALWFLIQHFENEKILYENEEPYKSHRKYHRFCYAAISGIVGAQSVLFAKCLAELFVNTFAGRGVLLAFWQTYLLIIFMCLTIFLQIRWLNSGLKSFDALSVVPVFQSFWILVSVVAGLIFFGEYQQMDSTSLCVFPIGILLTIVGVFFLSGRRVADPADGSGGVAGAHSDKIRLIASSPPALYIDPRIGFQGYGAPAVFTASSMGRCAIVFSTERPRYNFDRYGAADVDLATDADGNVTEAAPPSETDPLASLWSDSGVSVASDGDPAASVRTTVSAPKYGACADGSDLRTS